MPKEKNNNNLKFTSFQIDTFFVKDTANVVCEASRLLSQSHFRVQTSKGFGNNYSVVGFWAVVCK
jgi:hypothetical protein